MGALVAGIVAVSACATSRRDTSAAPTRQPPQTSASATTITRNTTTTRTVPIRRAPTPAFSFDDNAVPPPKIVDAGTDYAEILKSFRLYGNWLAAYRPDPTLIPRFLVRGRTFDDFASDLEWYRANSRRAIELLRGSIDVSIISTRPDAFSARVVEDIVAHQEVDASGAVTSDIRYTGPTTYLELVVRVGGKWRMASDAIQQAVDVHL